MFYELWAFGFVVSMCHAKYQDVSFDAWFTQLNDDLRVIYQYTAHFAWELRYEIQKVLKSSFKFINSISKLV